MEIVYAVIEGRVWKEDVIVSLHNDYESAAEKVLQRGDDASIEVFEGGKKTHKFISYYDIQKERRKKHPKMGEAISIEIANIDDDEDDDNTAIGRVVVKGLKLPLKLKESYSSMFDKYEVEVVFAIYDDVVRAYTNKFNKFLRRPDKLKTAPNVIAIEDSFYATDDYHAVFV